MDEPRRTPLHAAHEQLGARMVNFGGWHMPVQYSGIIDEHHTVRQAVGLFDVSHMGELVFRGDGAQKAVQRLVTNDVTRLEDGAAQYTVMCQPDGGIVDDCIVYRRSATDFLVIVNASNIEKDLAWARDNVGAQADIANESDATALIAVQGPRAVELVSRIVGRDLDKEIPSFHFATVAIAGAPCAAARTGYTGEDGFELAIPAGQAVAVWNHLLDAGQSFGVKPAGLGARDTLRLEARLSLYGNDIDATTTPLEAGLGWVVKLGGDDFIGKQALEAQKKAGVTRKLVGFEMLERGIARHDYPIVDSSGAAIGRVTSGTTGPTVGKAIGMGYVPADVAKAGGDIVVDCRGKKVPARIVKGPFYKRPPQKEQA